MNIYFVNTEGDTLFWFKGDCVPRVGDDIDIESAKGITEYRKVEKVEWEFSIVEKSKKIRVILNTTKEETLHDTKNYDGVNIDTNS